MKPYVANKKMTIMEVVGRKGQRVAEYCDKGKDDLPYQQLIERAEI